jgi:hypothetical protein
VSQIGFLAGGFTEPHEGWALRDPFSVTDFAQLCSFVCDSATRLPEQVHSGLVLEPPDKSFSSSRYALIRLLAHAHVVFDELCVR